MLIRREVLDRIMAGEVTAQYRRWTRPTVKAGGRLTTQAGMLAIHTVEPVAPADLTRRDVAAAGYPDVASMLADVRPDGILYRVTLSPAGADPRIALREDDHLTAEVRADIAGRLARLDRNRPWTTEVLRLIEANPGVRAGDLADLLGRERLDFKNDVRKLKTLGLTESLTVGYRLSPRGAAYVADLPAPTLRAG